MEISEAVQRILRVHWILIAACAIAGVAAGFVLHVGDRPAYAASARVVLDTADPQGSSDSAALASGARAIVTSPSHVATVLDGLRVRRDPIVVASRDVSLEALGTSGVLQLSVQDPDPKVAADLANGLAVDLIDTRLQIDRAEPTRHPMVVDPATPPTQQVSGRRLQDMVLGLMLGLVAGIGAAAALETFRPTVASSQGVARALQAPLIGELLAPPDVNTSPIVGGLGHRLNLAMEAAHVRSVHLVAAGHATDLTGFADQLSRQLRAESRDQLHPHDRSMSAAPSPHHEDGGDFTTARVGVFGAENHTAVNGLTQTGIVLVAPSTVKRSELIAIGNLQLLTRSSVLGVITYRHGLGRGWAMRPGASSKLGPAGR